MATLPAIASKEIRYHACPLPSRAHGDFATERSCSCQQAKGKDPGRLQLHYGIFTGKCLQFVFHECYSQELVKEVY